MAGAAELPLVSAGAWRYRWRELDPSVTAGRDDWTHAGLAVDGDGRLVTFDQAHGALAWLSPAGEPLARVPIPASLAHGITPTGDGLIWIADPGTRTRVEDGRMERAADPGRVFAVDAPGTVRTVLDPPPESPGDDRPWRPTSVAIGPDGTVWVADGYGTSRVHRYRADGVHVTVLDGTDGPGRFDCPHAVAVDDRRDAPAILVADRGNALVHELDPDGRHLRTFGRGELSSPSGFAVAGDLLVVAELRGRLALFDPDGRLAGYLGDDGDGWREPGWPNRLDGERIARPELQPGRFGSPHGIASAPDGRIVVTEWLLGGRIVSLEPVTA